jgi:hypothetical protein
MRGDAMSPGNPYGSQANEAWARFDPSRAESNVYVGRTTNVVGVLDTGIDYKHVDLYLNVWLNQEEIPSAYKATDVIDKCFFA